MARTIISKYLDRSLIRELCLSGTHLDKVLDELNKLKTEMLIEHQKCTAGANQIHIRIRIRQGDGTRSTDDQDCSLASFSSPIKSADIEEVTDWYAIIELYSICHMEGEDNCISLKEIIEMGRL